MKFAAVATTVLGFLTAVALVCTFALRRGAAARSEGTLADTAAQRNSLRSLTTDTAGPRRLYSTSTSYCYEAGPSVGPDCWESKPDASTDVCNPQSSTTTCRCPAEAGTSCNIDDLGNDPPTTGRCSEIKLYVPGGEVHTQPSSGSVDVTGDAPEVYCENMVHNDQWGSLGLVSTTDDGPAQKDVGYWSCWSPYTWRNGQCLRSERFLGESCWDSWSFFGWWATGICAGSDTSYEEYSTACYQGECVPYAAVGTRDQCECAWFGWNFIVACSSADDVCNGHACVLSTGDGNKYCDYATSQNW